MDSSIEDPTLVAHSTRCKDTLLDQSTAELDSTSSIDLTSQPNCQHLNSNPGPYFSCEDEMQVTSTDLFTSPEVDDGEQDFSFVVLPEGVEEAITFLETTLKSDIQDGVEICDNTGRSITTPQELDVLILQEVPAIQTDLVWPLVQVKSDEKKPYMQDHGSYTSSSESDVLQDLNADKLPVIDSELHSLSVVNGDLKEPDPFMGVSQEYTKTSSFAETFNADPILAAEPSTEQNVIKNGDAVLDKNSFVAASMQEENLVLDAVQVKQVAADFSHDENFAEETINKQTEVQDGRNSLRHADDVYRPDHPGESKKQELSKRQRKILINMVEQFKQNKSSFIVSKLPNRASNQNFYRIVKR